MKMAVFSWGGVAAAVFYMDKGDKIGRHRHPNAHNTCVIAGTSLVKIWRDGNSPASSFDRLSAGQSMPLPADLDHEVEALDDGTIVLHMGCTIVPTGTAAAAAPYTGKAGLPGGVTLHDHPTGYEEVRE